MDICDLASPGHYVKEQGAHKQLSCVEGTYAPNAGARECLDANAGFFVDEVGATSQMLQSLPGE